MDTWEQHSGNFINILFYLTVAISDLPDLPELPLKTI